MPYKHLPKKFQGTVEEVSYQKPDVDITEAARTYIDGVISQPKEEQEYLVKKFTENKVNLVLEDWKTRYRQNDEVIENIENHLKDNDEKRNKLNTEKDNAARKLEKLGSKKHEDERHIEDVERNAPGTDHNKKSTLIFLILVAVGLAILTAYKFATAMGEISLEVDGGKLEFIHYILYGLGALSILATGKIINVVYEKLHFNKSFFLLVATLAVVLAGLSAYSLADDKAFLNTKAYVVKDVDVLEEKIKKISKKLDKAKDDLAYSKRKGKVVTSIEEEITSLEAKKHEQVTKLTAVNTRLADMKDDAIGLDKIMLILILFTEMFVGGVAWMYATDYSRYLNNDKRSYSVNAVRSHIENSTNTVKTIEERIKEIEEEIEHLRLEDNELHAVLKTIKTEEEIDKVIQLVIEDETNMALSYLWQKNV